MPLFISVFSKQAQLSILHRGVGQKRSNRTSTERLVPFAVALVHRSAANHALGPFERSAIASTHFHSKGSVRCPHHAVPSSRYSTGTRICHASSLLSRHV